MGFTPAACRVLTVKVQVLFWFGRNLGGILLGNSLQPRTRKTPRVVTEDGKRTPLFSAYGSGLVVSC